MIMLWLLLPLGIIFLLLQIHVTWELSYSSVRVSPTVTVAIMALSPRPEWTGR